MLDNVFQTMEGSLLKGDVVRTPFGSFAVKLVAVLAGGTLLESDPERRAV